MHFNTPIVCGLINCLMTDFLICPEYLHLVLLVLLTFSGVRLISDLPQIFVIKYC